MNLVYHLVSGLPEEVIHRESQLFDDPIRRFVFTRCSEFSTVIQGTEWAPRPNGVHICPKLLGGRKHNMTGKCPEVDLWTRWELADKMLDNYKH
jgi:hypothetical protein